MKKRRSKTSKNTTKQSYHGDTVVYTTHSPKIPDQIRNGVHSFIRKAGFPQILSNNSAPQLGAFAFKLSDFPSYTEFTGLYDQFRIVHVDVQFLHLTNAVALTNSANAILLTCPRFITVLDYDNASSPANLDELRQYSNAVTVNADTSFYRSFTPATLVTEYIGVTSGYSPAYGKWHDCTYATTPHYGLKYALDSTNITGQSSVFGYNVEVTLHLEFRNSR